MILLILFLVIVAVVVFFQMWLIPLLILHVAIESGKIGLLLFFLACIIRFL